MLKTLTLALVLVSSLAAQAQQTYCNTVQQCRANGGVVSSKGKKCLYDDGQVKSFVMICGVPDYGVPFGCANGNDDAACDYNPETNPDGFSD